MGFFCPVEGCINHRVTWSRSQLRDEGITFSMRCPAAMCGSLLQKRQELPVPAPTVAPVRTVGQRPQTCPKIQTTPAPLKKQMCDIVVRVDPPGLDMVYPALVRKELPSCAVRPVARNQQIPCIPFSCAPAYLKKDVYATRPIVKVVKTLPPWVKAARKLLKAALSGAGNFAAQYCRKAFPAARLVWALGMLAKSSPPSPAIGRQFKKSFLNLEARIAAAKAAKQSKRAERRRQACRLIRIACQQARGWAAYERQQAKVGADAGVYNVRVWSTRPTTDCTPIYRGQKKKKQASRPAWVASDEATFDFDSLPVLRELTQECASMKPSSPLVRAASNGDVTELIFDDEECEVVVVYQPSRKLSIRGVGVEKGTSPLETLWWCIAYTPQLRALIQRLADEGNYALACRYASALVSLSTISIPAEIERNLLAECGDNMLPTEELLGTLEEEVAEVPLEEMEARMGMRDFALRLGARLMGATGDIENGRYIPLPQSENPGSATPGIGARVYEAIAGNCRAAGAGTLIAADMFCQKLGKWKEGAEQWFVDICTKLFKQTLGKYLDRVEGGIKWMSNIWSGCATWIRAVMDSSMPYLQALKEHALWAFVVTVVGSIMILVEKALQALGLVVATGGLLNLFISAFLLSVGFSAVFYNAEQIAEVHKAIRVGVIAMIQPDSTNPIPVEGATTEMEARSILGIDRALFALTSLGKSLVSMNLGTLQYYAKIGQAFDQLSKGKRAIEELSSWLLEIIGNMYDAVTGKRAAFFDELSAIVSVDVRAWLRRTQRAQLEAVTMSLASRELLEQIEHLLDQGQRLLIGVSGVPRRTSMDFTTLIRKEVDALEKLVKQCARAGKYEGRRVYPFWIYCLGESQSGKTNYTNQYLVPELLEEMGCAKDSQYTRCPRDQYWSGYQRQACVKIDDMYATKTTPSCEAEMIHIVNSEMYPLNMADLEDKGMLFDSQLVITTCNSLHPPCDAEIRDNPSFYNRRGAVVECRRKAGTIYDPEDCAVSMETRLLQTKVPDGFEREDHENYTTNAVGEEQALLSACVTISTGDHFPKFIVSGPQDKRHLLLKCALNCPGHSTISTEGGLTEAMVTQVHWMRCCRPKSLHEALTPWQDPRATLASLKTMMMGHLTNQWKEIGAMRRRQGLDGPIRRYAREHLRTLKVDGVYIPPQDKEALGIKDPSCTYVAVDQKLYSYDAMYRLTEVEIPVGFPTVQLQRIEQSCQDSLLPNIQTILESGPQNALVGTFIGSLVGEHTSIIDVDNLNKEVSQTQHEFWKSLDLTERVFLRLAQKRILSVKQYGADNVLGGVYGRITACMADSYRWIREHGGTLLLLLAGLVCTFMAMYSFYYLLAGLIGGTSYAAGVAALVQMDARSVHSSSSYGDSYRARARGTANVHRYMKARSGGGDARDWESLIVEIHCHDGPLRLVSACQFKGRSLLLTRHQAMAIPHGSQVRCEYEGLTGIYLMWDHTSIMHFEDSELVVYEAADLHALALTKERRFFMTDAEKQLPPTFEVRSAVVHMGEDGIPKLHDWTCYGTVLNEHLSIVKEGGKFKYQRTVPRYIQMGFTGKDNDCGALCVTQIAGQNKIVGLFCASSRGQSAACVVPNYQQMEGRAAFDFVEKVVSIAPGYTQVGYLPPGLTPRTPTKTQFVQVPEAIRYPVVNCKEPAILSSEDSRLAGKVYDPLREGMHKFAEPMGQLDQAILESVANDMIEEWFDADTILEDVSLEVALNGVAGDEEDSDFLDPLVLSTSEGYPFVLTRNSKEKGKGRFVEGLDGERTLIEGTPVHTAYLELCRTAPFQVPELICMEIPKDERLPSRKIQNPKTRLFSVLPMHYNIRLREKFLSFSRHMMRNRHRLPGQVGVNPYSREWGQLYMRLASKSDEALNCDYKGFDGLMTNQILNIIADMINEGYAKDSHSRAERKNLLMAIWGRYSIAGRQVYQVNAGIPSGCALTVVLNCIFNEILVRYCYKTLVPGVMREQFAKNVCLLTYGDDNLIAVSESVSSWFHGNALKGEMAKFGVTITDGTDKNSPELIAKPLLQLDFLKRGFKKASGGRITAPLDKMAIYSSLVWVAAKDGDVLEKLFQNVQVALTELYLHSREEFEEVRAFYVQRISMWDQQLTRYAESGAFHDAQYSGLLPWSPVKAVDILVEPQFKAMMAFHQCPDNECFPLLKWLSLAGPKYRAQNSDELIVSISPQLSGECAILVHKCPCEVPTQGWVDEWRSSKHVLYARLHAAVKAGRHLVFRSHAPYLQGWLAAASFARTVEDPIKVIDTLRAIYFNVKGKADFDSYFGSKWKKESAYGHLKFEGAYNVPLEYQEECRKAFSKIAFEDKFPKVTIVEEHGDYIACLKCGEKCPGHQASGKSKISSATSSVQRAVNRVALTTCFI